LLFSYHADEEVIIRGSCISQLSLIQHISRRIFICYVFYRSAIFEPCWCLAGRKFPLEQANEAIKESQKEARGPKVFLEG